MQLRSSLRPRGPLRGRHAVDHPPVSPPMQMLPAVAAVTGAAHVRHSHTARLTLVRRVGKFAARVCHAGTIDPPRAVASFAPAQDVLREPAVSACLQYEAPVSLLQMPMQARPRVVQMIPRPRPVVQMPRVPTALCFGLDYPGLDARLRGGVAGAERMADFLTARGYQVTLVTDRTAIKPTRKNMLIELHKLMDAGIESLVFTFSGRCQWANEPDDAIMLPLDYRTAGSVTGTQLREVLAYGRSECRMTLVFDSESPMINLRYSHAPNRPDLEFDVQHLHRHDVVCIGVDSNSPPDDQSQGMITTALIETIQSADRLSGMELLRRMYRQMSQSGSSLVPAMSSTRPMSQSFQM